VGHMFVEVIRPLENLRGERPCAGRTPAPPRSVDSGWAYLLNQLGADPACSSNKPVSCVCLTSAPRWTCAGGRVAGLPDEATPVVPES
jgi:hypothetical protein